MTLRSISGFEPLRTLAASIKKYVTVYCQMSPQLGRNYELLLTLMLQMCQLLSLCASSIMSPVHWIRLEVIGTPLAVVTIWQVTEGVLGWSCLSGKGEAAVRTTLQTKALWMSSMCCFNVREELGIFLHKLHWNIFSSACPTTWDLIMSQSGILFAAIPASESLPCVSQQMLPQVVLHRKASLAHVALEGFTTARAV